jgi:hypothetical protein
MILNLPVKRVNYILSQNLIRIGKDLIKFFLVLRLRLKEMKRKDSLYYNNKLRLN